MQKVLDQIQSTGIIPVVVLHDVKDAAPLAKALYDGGLPCAEVTFRSSAAEASVRSMAAQYPDMLIGAGTILTTEQVDCAVDAGAKFIVSPGFDIDIVNYCQEREIPVIPGVVTPGEAAQAVKAGLHVVKFFPAESFGGLPMIRALSAPYQMLTFMPTGGINSQNVKDYLEFDRVIACGGSWMVPARLIAGKRFDEIEKMAKETVNIVKEIRGQEVGNR